MSPAQRLRHALALIALIALLAVPGLSRADSYQYDELGNVQTLSTPRGVRGYTYDEVQRLDTESGYTGTRDHAYDRNGNRTSDGASVPTPVTFGAGSNRVATINGVAIVIDAAGQMASDGTNQLTWDDAGRLKTVSRSGTLYATYYYDHRQRRTRKVTTAAAPQGARTIVYHYDEADRLIAETSETGVPLRSYLWADDTLLAQVEYQFNATSGLYTVLRELIFELDHLGTPRQARLTDGTVVWRWESDGYGNTAPNQDPDGNGQATYVYLRFPGQYYDEESGLHYNGHRYYAPRLGRYLSSDPIGVRGGVNTYGYVGGNPTNSIDPTGLDATVVRNGSNVDVQVSISLQGQYGASALAEAWQASINQLWNQQTWNVSGCHVKFTVKVDVGGNAPNQITVGAPGVAGRSYVNGVGGSSGTWYADSGNWTPAHETGHLMGLGDRYTDVNGVSVPHPEWKGNVMGDFGGIADLRNIQEILKRNMGLWDRIKCGCAF